MNRIIFVIASMVILTPSLAFKVPLPRMKNRVPQISRRMSQDPIQAESQKALDKIEQLIQDNKVMLFMKGNKLFPQCGFSNTAVQILTALESDFQTFDVLADQFVREEIKKYSAWPTIPQLYIDGEFIGGCDIMIEMYQSGELETAIED